MLEAIFFGIIQGLTEFLPISSSAHVRIFGEFLPVKAVAGETIQVSATAVIEGHEKLSAQVVLHDSKGKVVSRADMKETWPGTNRYEGSITIPAQGDYFFVIEADSTCRGRRLRPRRVISWFRFRYFISSHRQSFSR